VQVYICGNLKPTKKFAVLIVDVPELAYVICFNWDGVHARV
jgi:hypothetical protein